MHSDTKRDTSGYPYGPHTDHGKRRIQLCVKRWVRAGLDHPMSKDMSDRAVAEHCGVSHHTVKRYKETPPTPAGDQLGTCPTDSTRSKSKNTPAETVVSHSSTNGVRGSETMNTARVTGRDGKSPSRRR